MKTTSFAIAVLAAILLPRMFAQGQAPNVRHNGLFVSQWIEKTKDPKPSVRKAAAIMLHEIGPSAKGVVPPLIRLLGDTDRDVRDEAAAASGAMGAEARVAVPALAGLLGDKEADVRRSAALALCDIGSVPTWAVPLLTKLLDDPEWYVRSAAAEALGRRRPGSQDGRAGADQDARR